MDDFSNFKNGVVVWLTPGGDLYSKTIESKDEALNIANRQDEDVKGQKAIFIWQKDTGYGTSQTKVTDLT